MTIIANSEFEILEEFSVSTKVDKVTVLWLAMDHMVESTKPWVETPVPPRKKW
jgi:hypothetical protein